MHLFRLLIFPGYNLCSWIFFLQAHALETLFALTAFNVLDLGARVDVAATEKLLSPSLTSSWNGPYRKNPASGK
jgi:hypothetical protein